MFCNFYWLFLGWKTSHRGVNGITTPLSVLSAAGTIPLSLDETELTHALSGKGEFSICIANHLSLTQGIPFCLMVLVGGRFGALCFLFPLLCLAWGAAQDLQAWMAWEHLWALSHTGKGKAKRGGVQHPGPCKGWKWSFIKERES